MDLVSRYKPEELPAALTSYVRNRPGYDYQHHCEVESDNANFVSDDVVDRFCLGVKNAMANIIARSAYDSQFVREMRSHFDVRDVSPATATTRRRSRAGCC